MEQVSEQGGGKSQGSAVWARLASEAKQRLVSWAWTRYRRGADTK